MFGVLEEVENSDLSTLWPEPRSGHRMCADENFLYVFGGYDPQLNNCLYNELWRYNITTGTWVRLPDHDNSAPIECASSAIVLLKDKVIVFGGSGYPFARTNSNKLYMYCLKTYKWINLNAIGAKTAKWSERRGVNFFRDPPCQCTERSCREPPEPKYGHSVALYEKTGELMIYSGTTGHTFTEDFHVFDLNELTWDSIGFCSKHSADMPCGRYRHEVVWNRDEFYLFGGSTLADPFKIDNIHSLNFNSLTWHKHPCTSNKVVYSKDTGREQFVYPSARKAHTCVIYDDMVYMVGGVNKKHAQEGEVTKDIWIFDLKSKKWLTYERLQFPRYCYFHGAAMTVHGCMYVFGGIDMLTNQRMNDLHKLWVRAPSLKEQTWLKVVERLKMNSQLSMEVLIKLGVPKNFHYRVDDSTVPAG